MLARQQQARGQHQHSGARFSRQGIALVTPPYLRQLRAGDVAQQGVHQLSRHDDGVASILADVQAGVAPEQPSQCTLERVSRHMLA